MSAVFAGCVLGMQTGPARSGAVAVGLAHQRGERLTGSGSALGLHAPVYETRTGIGSLELAAGAA
ncbi:MAG: hypothetical protein WA751_00250 [Candidatus Dormiibacterota bacterium]